MSQNKILNLFVWGGGGEGESGEPKVVFPWEKVHQNCGILIPVIQSDPDRISLDSICIFI